MRDWKKNKLLSAPAYSAVEAARILSVNCTTLTYWIAGRRYHSALIKLASSTPSEFFSKPDSMSCPKGTYSSLQASNAKDKERARNVEENVRF